MNIVHSIDVAASPAFARFFSRGGPFKFTGLDGATATFPAHIWSPSVKNKMPSLIVPYMRTIDMSYNFSLGGATAWWGTYDTIEPSYDFIRVRMSPLGFVTSQIVSPPQSPRLVKLMLDMYAKKMKVLFVGFPYQYLAVMSGSKALRKRALTVCEVMIESFILCVMRGQVFTNTSRLGAYFGSMDVMFSETASTRRGDVIARMENCTPLPLIGAATIKIATSGPEGSCLVGPTISINPDVDEPATNDNNEEDNENNDDDQVGG